MIRYAFFMMLALGCVAMAMHHVPTSHTKVHASCEGKATDCTQAKRENCCGQAQNKQVAYASLHGGIGEVAPAEEVKFFSGSWKELLAKASKDKKPFWVDVYTSWCGPCKMMSKFTFTDDEVGKASNKSFLAYKTDAEKGEGIKISAAHNVTAYPTILFFSADGTLLGREEGMQDAERFVYTMNKYIKKAGKSKGKKGKK